MPRRPPAPLVRIIDDALPPQLFAQLRRAVTRVGTERLRVTYQTTFWHPLGAPPSNRVEAAMPLLGRLIGPPQVTRLHRAAGVEWWLSRMRTGEVQVDFHQDRDEKLALATGRQRHPLCTSVLFLDTLRGGALAVTEQPANDANPARAPDRLDFDLVAPRANRFAFFDGRLTHGVLDAHDQIPSGRLPGRHPLRRTIILNWWDRRPRGVATFAEADVYAALRLAGPGTAASPRRPAGSRSATR